MNLEAHLIAVSDIERSKKLDEQLRWRLDEDLASATDVRIVQFTPPGSGCSVTGHTSWVSEGQLSYVFDPVKNGQTPNLPFHIDFVPLRAH